jgi:hypothetical protein
MAVSLIVVTLSATLLPGTAASADEGTTVAFDKSTETVRYGSDWWRAITVSTQYQDVLDTEDGTIDVYADGAPTAFASGLALYRGGVAYLTPDSRKAPLATGSHTLTAIYRPASGSGLNSSQTVTPLTVTVTPLALTATAALDQDAASPTLQLGLSGAYVDALSVPAGEWRVTVTDPAKRTVFTATAPQRAADTNPVEVDMGRRLHPGDDVTITATFSSERVVGATLSQPKPLSLELPALTAAQVLGQPVPPWMLILAVVLMLLAALWFIIQIVWLARHPAPSA